MSEFDKVKDEAEKYAQEHPQQVKKGEQAVADKGEQAVADKLGMDSQAEQTSREDQNTPPRDPGAGNQDS